VAIALEIVVEVGVCVEVDNGQVFEVASERAHDGVSNGVVAPKANGALALD